MSDTTTTTNGSTDLVPADQPPAHRGEVVHEASAAGELGRPSRAEVLKPLDVAAQRDAMALYQQGLQSILDESDWQNAGRGRKFVKKSGWRKIAAWFSLNIEIRGEVGGVERAEDGSVLRAHVVARAVAPNGRHADGDGYCDVSESRFADNKAKLENDLRGTATTRAVNRAVSNLVGMGEVSAEEVNAGGRTPDPEHDQALINGTRASDELARMATRALRQLLGDRDAVNQVAERIHNEDGHLAAAAARALHYAAKAQERTHAQQPQAATVPHDPEEAAAQAAQARMNAVAANYREHDQPA